MSDGRAEALLRSALEKIVYFEARSETLQSDAATLRSEADALRADLASASQRELELRRRVAELEVELGRSHRDREEAARVLDAMRAGVNELVAEPMTQVDLKAAIDRVVQHRQPKAAGQIFAVIGAKGGVGTTTIAVNVATALRKLSKQRTLLIDLNLACGDAAVFLGAEPRFSVLDAIENRHRLDAAFFHGIASPTKAGPDLLAASDRPTLRKLTSPH